MQCEWTAGPGRGALGRVARQHATHGPSLDSEDRQSPATNPPAGVGACILVVVAQVPDHIDELVRAITEVMRDARNASARGAGRERFFGERTVDLTDDRVLGALGLGDRGEGRGDGGLTAMGVDRP